MNAPALVLAGGRRRRMEAPKASLPTNSVATIESVLKVVGPIFLRTWVVVMPETELPRLKAEVVFNKFPDVGPHSCGAGKKPVAGLQSRGSCSGGLGGEVRGSAYSFSFIKS